jgi:sulfur relay protein TusB/DsrH
MATLHLVNRSPARSDALAACLPVLRPGDGLLLAEDAVLAIAGTALETLPDGVTLYALAPDVLARGLDGRLPPTCRMVDAAGFVRACTEHDRVVTWT